MCLAASRETTKLPIRLTSSILRKRSTLVSSAGTSRPMPAELTTPGQRPELRFAGGDGADDGLLVSDVHLLVSRRRSVCPRMSRQRSRLPIEIRDDSAPALRENRLDDSKADARGSSGHEHCLLLVMFILSDNGPSALGQDASQAQAEA